MSIKEWFQSWWWPSRIRSLQYRSGRLAAQVEDLKWMVQEAQAVQRSAEEEARRMREKWLTATRALEHEKEQAVQQKAERRAIYEQRDEARMALKHFAQVWSQGKAAEFKMPEWFKDPHADLETRMKAGDA